MPPRLALSVPASLSCYLAAVDVDDDPLVRLWWRALSEDERRELLQRAIEQHPERRVG